MVGSNTGGNRGKVHLHTWPCLFPLLVLPCVVMHLHTSTRYENEQHRLRKRAMMMPELSQGTGLALTSRCAVATKHRIREQPHGISDGYCERYVLREVPVIAAGLHETGAEPGDHAHAIITTACGTQRMLVATVAAQQQVLSTTNERAQEGAHARSWEQLHVAHASRYREQRAASAAQQMHVTAAPCQHEPLPVRACAAAAHARAYSGARQRAW